MWAIIGLMAAMVIETGHQIAQVLEHSSPGGRMFVSVDNLEHRCKIRAT